MGCVAWSGPDATGVCFLNLGPRELCVNPEFVAGVG
jgi:hypothetical protein